MASSPGSSGLHFQLQVRTKPVLIFQDSFDFLFIGLNKTVKKREENTAVVEGV